MEDDLLHGADAFLCSEVHLVVFAADVRRHLKSRGGAKEEEQLYMHSYTHERNAHLTSSQDVRTIFGSDGKRLNFVRQLLLFGQLEEQSGDQAGVQAT